MIQILGGQNIIVQQEKSEMEGIRQQRSQWHSLQKYKQDSLYTNPQLSATTLWTWGRNWCPAREREFISHITAFHFIHHILLLDLSMSKWRPWQKWRTVKPKIRSCIIFRGSLVNLGTSRELRSDIHFDTSCDIRCEHHSLVFKVLHL